MTVKPTKPSKPKTPPVKATVPKAKAATTKQELPKTESLAVKGVKTPSYAVIHMDTLLGRMSSPVMAYERAQQLFNFLEDKFSAQRDDANIELIPAKIHSGSAEFTPDYRDYLLRTLCNASTAPIKFNGIKGKRFQANIEGNEVSFEMILNHDLPFRDALVFKSELPTELAAIIDRYNAITGMPSAGAKASVTIANGVPVVVMDDGRKFELRPVD